MKRLIFLLITISGIILIYSLCNNKKNYVSITDIKSDFNNYIYDLVNYNDYFKSTSIYNTYKDIRDNRTIKVGNKLYYLKKVLRESDVLLLGLGMNELKNNFSKYDMSINYSLFDKMYTNIIKLIHELKKYAYGKIIFLGYYNPTKYYDSNIDRFFYDINIKLERLMINNNIIYIDLYELFKEKSNNFDINYRIANIIKFYLK